MDSQTVLSIPRPSAPGQLTLTASGPAPCSPVELTYLTRVIAAVLAEQARVSEPSPPVTGPASPLTSQSSTAEVVSALFRDGQRQQQNGG